MIVKRGRQALSIGHKASAPKKNIRGDAAPRNCILFHKFLVKLLSLIQVSSCLSLRIVYN